MSLDADATQPLSAGRLRLANMLVVGAAAAAAANYVRSLGLAKWWEEKTDGAASVGRPRLCKPAGHLGERGRPQIEVRGGRSRCRNRRINKEQDALSAKARNGPTAAECGVFRDQ